MATSDEPQRGTDGNQLSLIPFVARCGYCGIEEEVPTRELADRWAREHFAACAKAPHSRNRRRDAEPG